MSFTSIPIDHIIEELVNNQYHGRSVIILMGSDLHSGRIHWARSLGLDILFFKPLFNELVLIINETPQ